VFQKVAHVNLAETKALGSVATRTILVRFATRWCG